MLSDKRIQYLDYTKGFAILLMVFGHVEVCNPHIFNWIYSFHMPIFFIICGMLMFFRKRDGDISWGKILRKRIYQLGFPYLFGTIFLVSLFLSLQYVSHTPIKITDYLQQFIFLRGVSVMWFIPCYVVAEVCLAVVVSSSGKWMLVPFVLFIGLYVLINYYGLKSMHALNVARMALGCLCGFIGFKVAKWNILQKCSSMIILCMIVVGTVLSQIEGYTSMSELNLGNPLLYFFTFLLLSIGFLSFFRRVEYNCSKSICKKVGYIFSYWGRNSIIILITHILILELFRLLDYKMFNLSVQNAGFVGSIPLTILILALEIPIIYLANHQLRFLFGKKK